MTSAFNTEHLHRQIERLRAGDLEAREELIRAVSERTGRIAHRMLQSFPSVRASTDTGDVVQNTLLRLLSSLRTIRPKSVSDFFTLAAYLTRQELIDLARRYSRRKTNELPKTVEDDRPSEDHLDAWRCFHEAVEQLPPEPREVVNLTFYHGWTQAQIGEFVGVDVRTVRRRWAAGCLALREALGDQLDELLS